MGNKIWLTGAVRSTKYGNRIVEIYPNNIVLGKFQEGTIGEFEHGYYPTETDSVDCSVESPPTASFTYSAEHAGGVPALFTIKIGNEIALGTTADGASITPIEVVDDINIYVEIKNFQPLIVEEGLTPKFKILITNTTTSTVIINQEVDVSDTTTTNTNHSFLVDASNEYVIELSTFSILP